jgi:hypothetical protein
MSVGDSFTLLDHVVVNLVDLPAFEMTIMVKKTMGRFSDRQTASPKPCSVDIDEQPETFT